MHINYLYYNLYIILCIHNTYIITDYAKAIFTGGLPSISKYYGCANNVASVPYDGLVEVFKFDSSGGEYYNADHSITIQIPEGAIPPGTLAHLELAVALYGPFHFPSGSCPVSPILWLCIQEDISLRKPINVTLPHFLTDLNDHDIECLGINFAKADHEQHSTDKFGVNRFSFKELSATFVATMEGSQGYGVLSTDHCCYLCITSRLSNPISSDLALKAVYFLWCIEEPRSDPRSRDTLHFCVTFCLPSCAKVQCLFKL